jgi:hypothetical protein
MKLTMNLVVLTFLMSYLSWASTNSLIEKSRLKRRSFTEPFMNEILSDPKQPKKKEGFDPQAPVYAMAALYTKKDLIGANQRLRDAWFRYAGTDKKITPEEAKEVKWVMRGWLRTYYLFYDKSTHFPGRLEKDVQKKMEELFFNYGKYKSTMQRANPEHIWFIHDSENHHMMNISNAYLALQTVSKKDEYKNKKLSDNHTVVEHVKAWESYFTRYPLERAKNGLFVEISPTYGKWFVGEFVNMYEFAESKTVRKAMENLLHLIWADWAVDQLNGTRGGGKTRCYQGGYSQKGGGDSWDRLAQVMFGIKPWVWNSHGGLSTLALLTSRYELPDIIIDIALGAKGDNPFVYKSGRPAKLGNSKKNVFSDKGYWMHPMAGDIIRYSYCLPEAIMGSWMINKNINYAAINTQNRWQGVIFSTNENARVFPQSLGLGNKKTYNQHLAVQHRNVMIVMNHPKARQTGQMRVFFPINIHNSIIEEDGWVIVKEGNAWLGIRVVDSNKKPQKNYEFREVDTKLAKEKTRTNSQGYWLWPKSNKPPVAFVLSDQSVYKTKNDFLTYLKTHEYNYVKAKLSYTFKDDNGEKISMQLSDKDALPKINGKVMNLTPSKVFDSPFLNSNYRSGVIAVKKGKRKLTLDFNIEK